MASIVCYNFNEICRLCLKQKKNNSPIYDDKKNLTLVNKIISIARIQIDENDNLPSLICHDCLQLVDKFHEFKLLIEISDRELRCCLKNKIIDNKIDVDKDDESTKEQIDYTIIVPTTQNYDDKCIETKEELTEQVDNGIVFMNDNDDDVDDVDDVNCELCSEPVGTINDLKNHISEHFFKQDDANNSRQNIKNNTDNDDEKNTTPTHTNDNDNDDNVDNKNQCNYCHKTIKKIPLKKHYEKCRKNTTNLICIECDKEFNKKSELRYHKSTHLSTPLNCMSCQKNFRNKQSFNIHMKRHTLGSRFQCDNCDKSYYTNSELARHVQKHLGQRKYPCSICDMSFLSKPELNRHLKYHTGLKRFQCNVCQKNYYESGHLKVHQRVHTGERPFVCQTCNKGFVTRSKLIRHVKIHKKL